MASTSRTPALCRRCACQTQRHTTWQAPAHDLHPRPTRVPGSHVRPVVVLRHEEPDHLGCGREVLTAAGLRVEDFDAWRATALPAPDDIAGLVVLGGSMSVRDIDEIPFLGAERELVRECVRLSVPLLGLCLGAQLLAAALGGRVTRAPHRSIGFLPVATTDAA